LLRDAEVERGDAWAVREARKGRESKREEGVSRSMAGTGEERRGGS
jgi:hypothetical protein